MKETFDSNRGGWDQSRNADYGLRIESGRYVFERFGKEGRTSAWTSTGLDDKADFFIECSFTKISEGDEGSYGILWGFDKLEDSYLFSMSPRGFYLYENTAKGGAKRLIDWTASNVIAKDTRPNRLAIKRCRDRYEFFVNGCLVAEMPYLPLHGPKVGFQVWGKMSVAMDDLVVGRYSSAFLPAAERDYRLPGPEEIMNGKTEFALAPERRYLFDRHYAADHFGLVTQRLNANRKWAEAASSLELAIRSEESSENPRQGVIEKWYFDLGILRFRLADYSGAQATFQKNLALVNASGDEPSQYSAMAQLGYTFEKMGKAEAALAYFRPALEFAKKLGREESVALQNANCARMLALLKRWPESVDAFEKAIASYHAKGNKQQEYQARLALGDVFAALGKGEEAGAQFRTAADLGKELNRSSDQARALVKLGKLAESAGKESEAFQIYDQAIGVVREKVNEGALEACEAILPFDRKRGVRADIARDLNRIGQVHLAFDRYEQAKAPFEEALPLYESFGKNPEQRSTVAVILADLAVIAQMYEKKYKEAEKLYLRAIEIHQTLGDKKTLAVEYRNLARARKSMDQNDRALDAFRRAMALDDELGDRNGSADDRQAIASCLNDRSDYAEARLMAEAALAADEALHRGNEILEDLDLLVQVLVYSGQDYARARELAQRALVAAEETGDRERVYKALTSLGWVHEAQGQYGQAMEHYQKGLALAELDKNEYYRSNFIFAIGALYRQWGRYDTALDYYRRVIEIDQKRGAEASEGLCFNNMAIIYDVMGQNDQAEAYFMKSLEIEERGKNQDRIAGSLANLGAWQLKMGRRDKALELVQRALEINRRIGRVSKIAKCFGWLGEISFAKADYSKAIEYRQEALRMYRSLGVKPSIAEELKDLGRTYFMAGRIKEARPYFEEALALIEELRLTAQGSLRRDFLASQIDDFQWLIASDIRVGDSSHALETVERSSAQYLLECLSQKAGAAKPLEASKAIEAYQKRLPQDVAVIAYANTWDQCGQLFVQKNGCLGRARDTAPLLDAKDGIREAVEAHSLGLRGITVLPQKEAAPVPKNESDLERVITYYRSLLVEPNPSKEKRDHRVSLARRLYDLLLGDLQEQIKGKRMLVIKPDGPLGLLPFETLIMPDGRYLVEAYDVRYIHSFGVAGLVAGRTYDENRRPLLAIGGAIYEQKETTRGTTGSPILSASLKTRAADIAQGDGNAGDIFGALGLGIWKNLPGTLAEVQALKRQIPGATLLTGPEASVSTLKRLSNSGELSHYKVLHFATHGLVLPELPELSSLVLSQVKGEQGEDAYLTVHKISALDLRADFVNLSACETGLGKIYGGEGVVGLTQAFLTAGANGISVSLWKVADEATATFMEDVYRNAGQEKHGYDHAICEAKRRFIRGEAGPWREPFYWAPFVYYGR